MLQRSLTGEFSTLARDGAPITWPTAPVWEFEARRFLITTSTGLPDKAFNVRREPRVSLLFSKATGSGLDSPPAVLVQGHTEVPEKLSTGEDIEHYWQVLFERQPSSRAYSRPLARRFMDWYYMWLLIWIALRRISWWPEGDFSRPPEITVDVDAG